MGKIHNGKKHLEYILIIFSMHHIADITVETSSSEEGFRGKSQRKYLCWALIDEGVWGNVFLYSIYFGYIANAHLLSSLSIPDTNLAL